MEVLNQSESDGHEFVKCLNQKSKEIRNDFFEYDA